MVKKKIDNRIRVMIENGVKLGHRTMILLVGDKSRDQVSDCTHFFNILINTNYSSLRNMKITNKIMVL